MIRIQRAIQRAYDGILIALNDVSVALIFITAIWIFGDVAGRFLFGRPIPGTTELVKTAILPIIFLGAPYTLRRNAHIRATVLVRHIPDQMNAIFDIICCLLGMTVFTLLAYFGWDAAVKAFEVKEFEGVQLRVPTYPSRFVMVLGSALLVIQFAVMLVKTIMRVPGKGAEPQSPEQQVSKKGDPR